VTIILVISRFASLLLPALPFAVHAAPGAETCQAKCALYHDAGATADLAPAQPAAAPPPRAPRSTAALVDDTTLALEVASALQKARIGGVQIEARSGRVTLKGVVDDAAAARRALQAAQSVAGVREIENRLVSADVFEHD
jgi:hyperosmotically inducible protein